MTENNNSGVLALTEIVADSSVVVCGLTGGRRQRQRLVDMGIMPGTLLKIVHNSFNSQRALLIDINGVKLVIAKHIAANILVKDE